MPPHYPHIPLLYERRLFQRGREVIVIVLDLGLCIFEKICDLFLIKSCKAHIERLCLQRLYLHTQEFFVPPGIECHAVVRDDVCLFLCFG